MIQKHELKTHPAPFAALWDGSKAYEIRKDDRHFGTGDVLRLREYVVNQPNPYTGREVHATVTWLSRGPDWGLPEGMCVMSLRVFAKVDPTVTVPT